MNDFLLYILKSTFCLSVLYLAFIAVMRKGAFFGLNRLMLITIVVFSFIVPLLYLPTTVKPIIQEQIIPQVSFHESEPAPTTTVGEMDKTTPAVTLPGAVQKHKLFFYSTWQVIFLIYLAGMFLSLIVFIHGIVSVLFMLSKAKAIRKDGTLIFILNKDISAFSFWKLIFISRTDYLEHGPTILTHERQHIRLGHFYDLMLMEMVKITHWFNPIIYWLIQDLKAIHEFQVDQHTLTNGIDVNKYQLLIIEKGVGSQKFALANSFNHCQIKKRITMMNQSKTNKAGMWKVATFLPLLALLLIFCSRKSGNELSNFDRCEVLNVSKCESSIFTIELGVDKIADSSDTAYFSNPNNLVYLRLASKSPLELSDGVYRYTSFPKCQLDSMTFTGIAYVDKIENKISSGTLELKKTGDNISISFQLYGNPSISKDAITGSYNGSYSFEDRSIYREDALTLSPKDYKSYFERLDSTKNTNACLSIEATYEGNYINKRRCSLYGIVKKAEIMKRAYADDFTINVSSSMENRMADVHEILGLPNPIDLRPKTTEPSFSVVPKS